MCSIKINIIICYSGDREPLFCSKDKVDFGSGWPSSTRDWAALLYIDTSIKVGYQHANWLRNEGLSCLRVRSFGRNLHHQRNAVGDVMRLPFWVIVLHFGRLWSDIDLAQFQESCTRTCTCGDSMLRSVRMNQATTQLEHHMKQKVSSLQIADCFPGRKHCCDYAERPRSAGIEAPPNVTPSGQEDPAQIICCSGHGS